MTAPTSADLHATQCAICGPGVPSRELYPATFRADRAFTAEVFSARRAPDRVHYRFVVCERCGLVRSDPAAGVDRVRQLYDESRFNYAGEVENLRATYGRGLERLARHGLTRGSLLEVGCGNGFFLEEALARGFRHVRGVEPSRDAVAQAGAAVRPSITVDAFRQGLFPRGSFNAICAFQVIDHLPDPAAFVDECRALLTPDGCLFCISHDVRSWSARLLGERSPIVDIEHTFLFSRATLTALLVRRGFQVLETGAIWNRYSIRYFVHMLPLASPIKTVLLRLCDVTRAGRLSLWLPLGNLFVIARPAKVAGG